MTVHEECDLTTSRRHASKHRAHRTLHVCQQEFCEPCDDTGPFAGHAMRLWRLHALTDRRQAHICADRCKHEYRGAPPWIGGRLRFQGLGANRRHGEPACWGSMKCGPANPGQTPGLCQRGGHRLPVYPAPRLPAEPQKRGSACRCQTGCISMNMYLCARLLREPGLLCAPTAQSYWRVTACVISCQTSLAVKSVMLGLGCESEATKKKAQDDGDVHM